MSGARKYHIPELKKCAGCRAPAETSVTRRWDNPKVWALDLDLAKEQRATWRRSELVMLRLVEVDGQKELRCRFCRPLVNLLPHGYEVGK